MKRYITIIIAALICAAGYSQDFSPVSERVLSAKRCLILKGSVKDTSGTNYIAGYFSGIFNTGNDIIRSNGRKDIFISAFDDNNKELWTKHYGNSGDDIINTLDIMSDNSLLISGCFSRKGGLFKSDRGAYIMKISNSGEIVNSMEFSNDKDLFVNSISESEKGIWISGFFSRNFIVDGKSIIATKDKKNIFIALLDKNLKLINIETIISSSDKKPEVNQILSENNLLVKFSNADSLTIGEKGIDGEDLNLLFKESGDFEASEWINPQWKYETKLNEDGVNHDSYIQIQNSSKSGYNTIDPLNKESVLDLTENSGLYYLLSVSNNKYSNNKKVSVRVLNGDLKTVRTLESDNINRNIRNPQMLTAKENNLLLIENYREKRRNRVKISKFFNCSNHIPLRTDDTTKCIGEKITITSKIGYSSYEWNSGVNNQSIEVIEPGEYIVKLTHSTGCIYSDSIYVDDFKLSDSGMDNEYSFCAGDSVVISLNSAIKYNWSSGDTTQTVKTASSGKLYADIIDKNGCNLTDSTTVIKHTLPMITLGNDTIIGIFDAFTINAGDEFNSYLWEDGSINNIRTVYNPLNFENSELYKVDATNDNGCRSSDSLRVYYKAEKIELNKYTTVSPNPSDGEFTIKLLRNLNAGDIINVKLITSSGSNVVFNRNFSTEEMYINTNLNAGAYTLNISLNNIQIGGYVMIIK